MAQRDANGYNVVDNNNAGANDAAAKPIPKREQETYNKAKYERFKKKGTKPAVPASKKAMKPLKRASSKPKYKKAVPAAKKLKTGYK